MDSCIEGETVGTRQKVEESSEIVVYVESDWEGFRAKHTYEEIEMQPNDRWMIGVPFWVQNV